jgi:hypothetical protein
VTFQSEPLQIDYEDFRRMLAERLRIDLERLRSPSTRLVTDLGLDELSLAVCFAVAGDVNPWFRLPEQFDIIDVTLLDLFHLCANLSSDHMEL